MRIYTRAGDRGETGLLGGRKVKKDDVRIEAAGTVDELNALIGVVRSQGPCEAVAEALEQVQQDLFLIGLSLATAAAGQRANAGLGLQQVRRLEEIIDRHAGQLRPLREFIIPFGVPAAAALHHARVVCRRAERRVVALAQQQQVQPPVLAYLNRLGDLLFVLARLENRRAGVAETVWQPP